MIGAYQWGVLYVPPVTAELVEPTPSAPPGTPPTIKVSEPTITLRYCDQCACHVSEHRLTIHSGWHQDLQKLAAALGLDFADRL